MAFGLLAEGRHLVDNLGMQTIQTRAQSVRSDFRLLQGQDGQTYIVLDFEHDTKSLFNDNVSFYLVARRDVDVRKLAELAVALRSLCDGFLVAASSPHPFHAILRKDSTHIN